MGTAQKVMKQIKCLLTSRLLIELSSLQLLIWATCFIYEKYQHVITSAKEERELNKYKETQYLTAT